MRSGLHDGQNQGGWVLIIVINRVRRRHVTVSERRISAGVQISIEARKVTAADFKPQYVSFAKDVAGGPQIEFEFIYLSRVH